MKHIKLFEGFKEEQDSVKKELKDFAYEFYQKSEPTAADWYELSKEIAKIKGFGTDSKMKDKLEELSDFLKKSFDGKEFIFDMEQVDDILKGIWTDPSGGKHTEDDDDPAAMYEENSEPNVFASDMSKYEKSLQKLNNNLWQKFEKDSGQFWHKIGADDWHDAFIKDKAESMEFKNEIITLLK